MNHCRLHVCQLFLQSSYHCHTYHHVCCLGGCHAILTTAIVVPLTKRFEITSLVSELQPSVKLSIKCFEKMWEGSTFSAGTPTRLLKWILVSRINQDPTWTLLRPR
jgi:hypothetical protein